MDWISELPEALLLRILSSVPAKDVVATMVLSKRWQFLWTRVPRLVYDDSYDEDIEFVKFSRFVDRSLVFHEAPVFETVHFKLSKEACASADIRVWIKAAENRGVRELIIHIDKSSCKNPAILPRNLYNGCRVLVTLKLNNAVFVDASSSPVSFPSLKTLSLVSVKYPGDEFVKSLLSNCPVLEDLHVRRCDNDNVTIFTIKVLFLKRISLRQQPDDKDGAHGLVIDAPSLEIFHIVDYSNAFCVIEKEMANIVEADIDIIDRNSHPGKILSSLVSVKRLNLCLGISKEAYPVGTVFHSLVHLRLCTCETEWLNLLMCLLGDSPKLKSLKLRQRHGLQDLRPCWTEPSSVPECLLSSLETFTWERYEGTQEEKEVAAFILRSASCLKKVTISSTATDSDKKLEMIKELSLSSRRSPTCQLAFD
uniref:Putative FBD-associated F-box protein n=1 Tax=Noccaea caerulescens TaxID=107243 RepID=A0A1J3HKJ6_NOCCA